MKTLFSKSASRLLCFFLSQGHYCTNGTHSVWKQSYLIRFWFYLELFVRIDTVWSIIYPDILQSLKHFQGDYDKINIIQSSTLSIQISIKIYILTNLLFISLLRFFINNNWNKWTISGGAYFNNIISSKWEIPNIVSNCFPRSFLVVVEARSSSTYWIYKNVTNLCRCLLLIRFTHVRLKYVWARQDLGCFYSWMLTVILGTFFQIGFFF